MAEQKWDHTGTINNNNNNQRNSEHTCRKYGDSSTAKVRSEPTTPCYFLNLSIICVYFYYLKYDENQLCFRLSRNIRIHFGLIATVKQRIFEAFSLFQIQLRLLIQNVT